MGSSREKREPRTFFDVNTSETKRSSKGWLTKLLYGKNVLNLRRNFRSRRPWLALAVAVGAAAAAFWGVRQLYTKAEVSDFFPAACLGDWQNTANAQGKPETLNEGGSFDENNSAVMSPGASSSQVFCGGFVPPDYAAQGDIQNVGLTLAWQVGDSPASSSFVVIPNAASSTNVTSSTNTVSSTNVTSSTVAPTPTSSGANVSSSTSLLPWFIARAFAQDVASGSDVSDSSTATATVPLGPPLIAPLTPIASGTSGSTVPTSTPDIGAASSTDSSSSSASVAATSTTASTTSSVPPSAPDNNFLEISYSTDGVTWIELAEVNPDNWQNFTATLPVTSWDDLENLQIKIEGIPSSLQQIPKVYLDGMLVEVHYDIPPVIPLVSDLTTTTSTPNSAPLPVAPVGPNVIVLPQGEGPVPSNANGDFKSNEAPSFDFNMNALPAAPSLSSTPEAPPQNLPSPPEASPPQPPDAGSSTTSSTSLLSDPFRAMATALNFFLRIAPWGKHAYADSPAPVTDNLPTSDNPIVAEIVDPLHHGTNLQPTFVHVGTTLRILLPEPGTQFRPGAYSLRLWIWQNGQIYYSESNFDWGVLVVNFNKSIYTASDTAAIGFGVLTDQGHTVCDAPITADITSPSGRHYELSTQNNTITDNASCGPQTVTNNPDYSATFKPQEIGTYAVTVTAGTGSGMRQVSDSFVVESAPLFDVSRSAPTRIYPPSTYEVTIHIKANQDYAGPITETVPSVFQVIPQTFATESFSGDAQSISWNVNMKSGDAVDLSYSFLAPDVSPELYKSGPLQVGSWQEARQWQIAADAVGVQIRQEINLTDTVVTSTGNDVAILNTTQYDGNSSSTSYYFEVVGKVTSGSATTTLRRFGTTTDDATISLNSTTSTVWRSAAFTPPVNASTSYFVNVTGGTSPQISAARIIIIQGGNSITKTETQIEIGNNETGKTNTTTSTGALASPKYWYYDSTKWDGSVTAYAEVAYASRVGPGVLASTTFTTSGANTWTSPPGNTSATIELWGAGGSGGGDTVNGKNGAGGGAGGSYSKLNSTTTTPGVTYSLTVAATTTATTGAGTQGASSSFNGATAVAVGGLGGGAAAGGAGGSGTTTGSVGDIKNAGGNGAAGLSGTEQSGGGGGGAGSGGVGGNAAGTTGGTGTANNPGGGGGAGNITAVAGAPGKLAGGGGAGASGSNGGNNNAGGDGAKGQVIITYHAYPTSTATFVLQHATSSFSWADDTIIVNAGGSNTATSVRASFTPTSGDYYRIVGETASSSVPYDIYGARVIIDQSGFPLSKLEPQYLLTNTLASNTAANQQAFTTFSPGEWMGVTNTYVHDVDASSTATSTVNLLNTTASTTLNTITGAKNETTSSIASIPAATSTIDLSIPQSAGTTYADRILADVSITIPSPIVSAVVTNGGSSTITLTPNTTTSVTVSYTVTESPGNCSNIFTNGNTTTTLYRAGAGQSCVASNSNCYIAGPASTVNDCSGGTVAHATTTFGVYYYAQSTGNASSSFPSDNWLANVQVFDGAVNTTSSATSSAVNIGVLTALNVPISSVNYGALAASANTGPTNQLVNIENAGNTSDTIQVNGTALISGANIIATSSQHYATSSFTYGGGEQALSDTATTISGIDIAPALQFPIGGAGWTQTQALPYADNLHTSVAYNGYLYTIGGCATQCPTSTVLYAPINATGSLGAWTSTQALPYGDYYHTSVAYNGYLYTIGGCATQCSTSTVLYSPINATGSLGAWTSTQALPYAVASHTSVAYNGYLYTIGGRASSTTTSTVLYAPINTTGSLGAWTSTQALPYALSGHTSVAYNGYLYTTGGTTNGAFSGATSTVLYAPINATGSLGAWTSTQALPYGDYYHTSVAYNGYLYTIGGLDSGGDAVPTVLYTPINATGSLGAWTSTQALPSALYQHASVAYNGYLYKIGGLFSNGTSTLYTPLNARSTYWGVSAPAGYPSGMYTGTVTFTAAFSN